MDVVISMQKIPRVGETVHAEDTHYIPGGKGANQALGCRRLDAFVTMVGAVGKDPFGEQLITQLDEQGVETDRILRVDGAATGTATIFQTQQDNSIAIVSGANSFCSVNLVNTCEDRIRQANLLLVQLEVPLESVHRAVKIAHSAGVTTILNPAPARPLPEELLRKITILTPNETEFEVLTGRVYASEAALEQGMSDWEQRYGHTLILTRGSQGCSYLDNGRLITVPAIPVQPVDTTGAGDAFNAALGYGISSGWPLKHAIPFAVKSASLSVTKFGAQNGMPTKKEVEQFNLK